ncbi:hypothetical protein RDI58_009809 [Solanum bulbocastanum]|uniref:Uncharacterized protein n=1 Tax=Solanum bulbocastanum TaxID=147425 RepID=A0AAN8TLM2_SOLBU
MNLSFTFDKAKEVQEQFKGKKVILGVDDMDIFKGIILKLLAFEYLLHQDQNLQGKLVLIQIVNPARSSGKDVQEAKRETYLTVERINKIYGRSNYELVILINYPVPRYEKTAYYAVAKCCLVNAVRDGMNLVPYKHIVCRQGSPGMDDAMEDNEGKPLKEVIVSQKCAEAVLHGAQDYVPGVLACSAYVERRDAVAVSVSVVVE